MKMRSMMIALAIVGLVGCGSDSSSTATSTTANGAVATTAATGKLTDANGVLQALKSSGIPVLEVDNYTAENDPNKKLGRPGGYTSKVNWHDSRAELKKDDQGFIDSDSGGSIEYFSNESDAKARNDYIKGIVSSTGGLVTEYDFLKGKVLLRVSGDLTPAQSEEYRTAFESKI
jgi:hypothetical protein